MQSIKIYVTLLCILALGLGASAQDAARPQRVVKPNSEPVSTATNVKASPSERQRIQPAKDKPVGVTQSQTQPAKNPAMPQRIQHDN
jgi:hypothetical protein